MTNMKRWSEQQLEKELYFAALADDGSPESKAWIAALLVECERRGQVPPINLTPNWRGGVLPRSIRDLSLEKAKGWKR